MEFLANAHIKIIHFPIAFLMLYCLIELLFLTTKKDFFNKAAFLFLILGVVGAFFAVLSGNQAFAAVKNWNDFSRETFNMHETYANITIWYFTALLIVRYFLFIKKKLTQTTILMLILFAILGSYFVYQTGNYGGKLAHQNVLKNISDI
jgi:uncharacterized membrane protein